MDDSALIRFFRRSGPVLRSASLLTAIAATVLAGCAARPGAGVATLSTTVPASSALVLPAPGTQSIVSVIQRQYTNAIEQQIALSTSAATPGQNFISIQAFGPAETVAMPGGALAFRPVQHRAIRSEIRTYFPGRTLAISSNFVRNTYGPFGYAYGRGAGDDGCLYGWQQIRSNVAERDRMRDLGMLQIRLRVCQAGASEAELVELMYGYTIVGGFSGETWNPYGAPASVDSQIGGGEPLRVPVAERRVPAVVPVEKARPVPVARRAAEKKVVPAVEASGDVVIVPSPTSGSPASEGEAVVVPSPVCVTSPSGSATCD
ncbi:cellulose biosynthesis protein BcsN [Shinella zoogloeoides]|uniref:Cellulose biosynthesis protein BcsN n=1 Tax=Shinella zoogloeoides TaxID=352475 RepID=A0A6N8TN78_SHIZO|nr:cellulose biosynthesis protein BcsN [Shinella zoogloeoides]MXO02594.1 cellulose biosynthesis protein BcsN [Shinella zoogloeoides]UEX82257.1 cellulose biosynthesis protein BcsN [Shinella zoogloeoides]